MTKRLDIDKKASFERFKDQHAIRLIMSMIPAGERPDVLDTLLREAHDHGFAAGTSSTILGILKMGPAPHVSR